MTINDFECDFSDFNPKIFVNQKANYAILTN